MLARVRGSAVTALAFGVARVGLAAGLLAGAVGAAGCRMRPDGASTDTGTTAQPTGAAAAMTARPSGGGERPSGAPGAGERPRFLHAGPGDDVAALVKQQLTQNAAERRELIVYVGATWCEPCQRFHEAVEQGRLDGAFPPLTFLQFDLDEDRERLAASGYTSRYIPLFVAPSPDGRASARKLEGSIKGEGSVDQIRGQLRDLLAKK
jgi:hypothetical protein